MAIVLLAFAGLVRAGSREPAYLEKANLQRTELDKLAWRLRDRAFFERLLALLRQRLVFAPELWSYGLLHRDAVAASEYLAQRWDFLAQCGLWLDSPLVEIDPVELRGFETQELAPLINARAHPFAGRREVFKSGLARQYRALLSILAYRPKLDDRERMLVTYYLLLQDRVAEALEQFQQVDPQKLASRLQYDYMRAYMDFYSDEHAHAGIKYARNVFRATNRTNNRGEPSGRHRRGNHLGVG